MRHIDEGRLHAYLDGAADVEGPGGMEEIRRHLAGCSACRVRLEDEQRVREQAGSLLGRAMPTDIPLPPFSEVQRRRSRPVPQRRLIPLVWAASVVFAVGLGWLARAGLRGPEEVAFQDAEPVAAPSPAAELEVTLPARARIAAAPPVAEAPPAAVRPAVRSTSAPSLAKRVSPAEASSIAAQQGTPSGSRAAERVAETQVAAAPAAPPAPEATSTKVEERLAAQRVPAPPPAALALQDFSGKAADARPSSWTATNRTDAERILGQPLRVIPDLPVLAIERGEIDGSPAVRVLQQMSESDTLALDFRRVGEPPRARARASAAPAAPSAPPGAVARASEPSEVTEQVEGLQVTARGPRPLQVLRGLLRRLR